MLVVCAVYAVARSVSIKAASGLAVLLVLLGAWDTFFSPLLTSSRTLALLFALTAIPLAELAHRRRGGTESVPLGADSPRPTR